MSALNVSILVLILMNSVSYGQELNLVAGVETTTPDAFEAFEAAEETIDPQKEYAQFRSAYEKLYKYSSHSKDIGYQQIVDDSEHRFMTTNRNIEHSSNDDNDSVSTTTTVPHNDDKYIQGNESTPNNETNESNAEPKQSNGFSSDYLLSRLSEPIDSTNSNEFADESNGDHSNKLEKNIQQNMAVYFVQNDASNIGHKENDSIDYVNDDGNENEENASQPITLPYLTDTTISSIPSAVNHLQTNVPAVNVPSTTTTTTVVSLMRDEPALISKKSAKKFETSPRLYKYSADAIIRKYLDDTFIRTPLATLINTAPEPLRQAKILWKSALRPNTPIDIVLVAFNSSGVGVTYSFKNTRTMMAGLDSVQESQEISEGGSGFYGILRASELVPYDSAIFISTDKIPKDTSLMKNAAIVLLKKRIRLYLIWFGGDTTLNEDESSIGGVLGAVALRSGGEIFRVTEEPVGNGELGLVTHFLQNDIQGAQLLDVNSIGAESQKQLQDGIDESTSESNGAEFNEMMELRQGLRMRRQNMRFEESDEINNDIQWPDEQTTEIEPDMVELQHEMVDNFTDFTRMAKNTQLETITKIDIGAQSQLMPVAGSWVQLYFEVTNLRDVPTFHTYLLVDEQRFLRSLDPRSAWIPPGQTLTAVASLFIHSNAADGTKDRITFSAQGLTTVTQSVVLTVKSPNAVAVDRTPPIIYWNFGSRCYGRTDAGRCAASIWSLEITTFDTESGILRVQSNPKGLLPRSKFTAGTRDEIKATYSASCCSPRVTITSYDVAGNQKTISIDVNDIYLGTAEIIAIILGVILIILIIAAIIVAIVYCCKRKESRDLPVYRGRAERDRS